MAPFIKGFGKDQPFAFVFFSENELAAPKKRKSEFILPHLMALIFTDGHMTLNRDKFCERAEFLFQLKQPEHFVDFDKYRFRVRIKATKSYYNTQRAYLSTIKLVSLLQQCLESLWFRLQTDCNSLRWILNTSDSFSQGAHWRFSAYKVRTGRHVMSNCKTSDQWCWLLTANYSRRHNIAQIWPSNFSNTNHRCFRNYRSFHRRSKYPKQSILRDRDSFCITKESKKFFDTNNYRIDYSRTNAKYFSCLCSNSKRPNLNFDKANPLFQHSAVDGAVQMVVPR